MTVFQLVRTTFYGSVLCALDILYSQSCHWEIFEYSSGYYLWVYYGYELLIIYYIWVNHAHELLIQIKGLVCNVFLSFSCFFLECSLSTTIRIRDCTWPHPHEMPHCGVKSTYQEQACHKWELTLGRMDNNTVLTTQARSN